MPFAILRPCGQCAAEKQLPENIQPAECLLRCRCSLCGDVAELALCPMCAVEVKAVEQAGQLHCSVCHGHPRHRCAPVIIDAEVPL